MLLLLNILFYGFKLFYGVLQGGVDSRSTPVSIPMAPMEGFFDIICHSL